MVNMTNRYNIEFTKGSGGKITCPSCRKEKRFRTYTETATGKTLPLQYGKCDRLNNCGYWLKPDKAAINWLNENTGSLGLPVNSQNQPVVKQLFIDSELAERLKNDHTSKLHKYLKETIGISTEHLQKWNLGTDSKGQTCFIFQKDLGGKYWNIKRGFYHDSGKRNKDTGFFSMSKKSEKEKYKLCLYGANLIDPDKDYTFIVESEKTAVIASWFYPSYNWVSCASADGLTTEKLEQSLLGVKKIVWLADSDKAGRENSSIRNLQAYLSKKSFYLDLFPSAINGKDLADVFMENPAAKKPDLEKNLKPILERSTEEKAAKRLDDARDYILKNYDLRENSILKIREYKPAGTDTWKPINKHDIYISLKDSGIKISMSDTFSLLKSSWITQYNPLAEYFSNLAAYNPDKDPDFIQALAEHVKVPEDQQQFFYTQFKKMLVRSLACTLEGIVNRTVFVLAGAQETGKSEFIRFLNPLPKEYYKEDELRENKDMALALSSCFIWNLEELAGISQKDFNKIKSIISQKYIRERKAYAEHETFEQRICNFWGSTNRNDFLVDDSGNSRWLVFEVLEIDYNYRNFHTGETSINIDDVYRQAFYLLNSGWNYTLTKEEKTQRDQQNKSYEEHSLEYEIMTRFFKPADPAQYSKGSGEVQRGTASELIELAASLMPESNMHRLEVRKTGRALKQLGFVSKRTGKGNFYYYQLDTGEL